MKKLNFSFVLMLLLGAVACRKNYNGSPLVKLSGNVSSDEAASMAAGALAANSNGVADISTDVTLNAASFSTAHLACGTVRADSILRQSNSASAATDAGVIYSYKLNYSYALKCDTGNHPDSLLSSLVYSGSYSGPNLSSSNSGSSIFNISGLASTAPDFVINGEYKRNGSFKSVSDTTNHGSNNIDIVITGLTVKKPARVIVSGDATISITGSVPDKGNFSYTGTLVFNGNDNATLTINGTVYMINLLNGRWLKH